MTARRWWPILTGALALACATSPPSPSSAPSAPRPAPRSFRYPARVTAVGIASGVANPHLARQAAAGRALRRLAAMLQVGAIRFRYAAAGPDSSLTAELPGARVFGAETLHEPIARGAMLARASVLRSDETLRALEGLTGVVRSRGESRHPDAGVALLLAENQAYREAVARSARKDADSLALRGTITVVSEEASVTASGVTITLELAVEVTARAALTPEETRAVHEAAAARHLRAGELAAAAASLERQLALDPENLELRRQVGKTALLAKDARRALAAFEGVVERTPESIDALRAALDAARAIPDPAKAAALDARIAKLVKADDAKKADDAGKRKKRKKPRTPAKTPQ